MCLESIQLPSEEEYVERGYSDDILKELKTFFSAREKYESLSVKHKRGNLLHGPPGTGKTYSIIRAIRECMEQFDLLVFLISRKFYGFSKLQKFNERFSHRNTVFLLEEVTSHAEMTGASLLSYLDGELSWNHHFTIATTNHPERLQANLVNRPGRFDRVIKFLLPDADFRRRFLEGHMDEEAITEEVIDRTEGFNISYLKELVLRTDVYDTDVETILDEFDEQKRMVENSFKESDEMVGFL
jgi:SpoVK/Ycf46/Vps4 family AAA+-type ATPase